MRAFLNLIFFVLILCCGLAGGYLFARTGNTVPLVGEQLDALVPASLSNGKSIDQLDASLTEQTAIAEQLNIALQTARSETAELRAQNEQLVATLNEPDAGGAGSAASDALVNDLIEQNQYLTDELTAVLGEKAEVESRLSASLNNPQQSADTGAAQQQITQLLSERQQMVQSLSKALADRDLAEADTRNLQAQLQSVIAQVQTSGGNIQQLLQNSGIDLDGISQGQSGAVLQNIINGLGN